jgi:inorganic triphosphatase YgiF
VEDRSQQEVELKLELPAEDARRVLRHPYIERHAEGPARVRRLRSVYFDTVDRALLHAGLALRVREIGEQRVQTLKAGEKARTGLFERHEDEVEIEGDVPELEAVSNLTLRGLLQRTLAGRTLRPIFVTDMERTQRRIRDGEDVFSLDLDLGEVRAGDAHEPLCELELELIEGDARRLYEAALDLLESVPLTVGFVTKSDRGYALAAGGRARQPIPEALARMRETLEAAPTDLRPGLEDELTRLERECEAARDEADLERLHRSPRFARAALELGRIALG